MEATTTLPVGLVAELLPKLRGLRVTSVSASLKGFRVSYVHETRHHKVEFTVYYAVHSRQEVYDGSLQYLSYEGNGVHVLKLARRQAFAGTVIKVEGLTFATVVELRQAKHSPKP